MPEFHSKLENIRTGYSFDDVLLLPAYSEVVPAEVDATVELSERVKLKVPLMSAPMDKVTEYETAIVMAQQGGIGIIHRAMSNDDQAWQVERVKRKESGIIKKPYTVRKNDTIEGVFKLMYEHNVKGFPVVDEAGKLEGLITNRDAKHKRPVDKVEMHMTPREMLEVIELGPEDVGLPNVAEYFDKAKKIISENRKHKVPLVTEDNRLLGLITNKDIENPQLHPKSAKDPVGRLIVGAAVGVGEYERAGVVVDAGADMVIVDSAHGHSKGVIDTLIEIKKMEEVKRKGILVVGGNIGTYEGAKALIEAGADIVKVGVGPGSICTTRVVSGAGVPQITAIQDAYRAACELSTEGKRIYVIADGGIKFSGDITKAMGAGAHLVMIGNLFAGTAESPGEIITFEGRQYKIYRGMGSIGAMQQHGASRYGQRDTEPQKLVPEGIEGRVPLRGPLADQAYQLVGGLRSGMGYCGCRNIEELINNARFIKITPAGLRESHVHDVTITQEAPNYPVGGGN